MNNITIGALLLVGLFAMNFVISPKGGNDVAAGPEEKATLSESQALTEERVYEMRIYTTHPGKLEDLHTRFRDHTLQLFAKHGMVNVGYWVPEDEERRHNTLIYILAHESREAASASWDSFRNDPVWQAAYEASHEDGLIVSDIESIYMKATPYSQIR